MVKCFYSLYQQGNPILRQHLPNVIKVVAHIFSNEQTPNDGKHFNFCTVTIDNNLIYFFAETKHLVVEFLKTMNRDFGEEFANSVSSLGPAVTENLQKLLS